MHTYEYRSLALSDLQAETATLPNSAKQVVRALLLDGEPLKPTKRFWTSLQVYYRFSDNIFNYFSHAEVFSRIAERSPHDRTRCCIRRDESGRGTLLAVSSLSKPVIHHDDLLGILQRYHAENLRYTDGMVSSTHAPPRGGGGFT